MRFYLGVASKPLTGVRTPDRFTDMSKWTRIQPGIYVSGGFKITRTDDTRWAVTLHDEPKRTLKTLDDAKRFVFHYLAIH